MTMQNPMMMMMMMNMMNGGGGAEGGGGMDLGSLMSLFGGGETPQVESVWEDAVTFGTARDRNGDATIGVLETRIVPPHADDPVPRVVIKTNGVIMSRPSDLRKIGSLFQKMADDPMMIEAFEMVSTDEAIARAQAERAEKAQSAMLMPMLGMNGNG